MSPALQFALAAALAVVLVVLVALRLAAGRPRDLVARPPPGDGGPVAAAPPQAQVLRLIRQRRKIEAIKVLRQQTGLPLAEAKRVVDELAAGGPAPPWPDATGPAATGPVDDALRTAVAALAHQGKKIQAIKLLRDRTGWKLAEAKRYVESL
ncbi:50S ribosomal protein L7/L12 [Micromonospora sp. SL1-18]|uniref:50S ribosomal protein L7/L12 n=1 Tax=Micromonospora sp. SL1-18 TaxID=3399128 RepID=UPI003A4E25EF